MGLLLKTNAVFLTTFFEKVISVWPFLIVLVVLLLAFLWFNQVKNMRRRQHRTDGKRMVGIINPIILLGIITLLIMMLLALPFFFEKLEEAINEKEKDEMLLDPENLINETFEIEGMESPECEELIAELLAAHFGIKMAEASYIDNKASVLYDTTLVSRNRIQKIIEESGFVIKKTIKE